MPPDRKSRSPEGDIEEKEVLDHDSRLWLGGVFALKGSINASFETKRGRLFSNPRISLRHAKRPDVVKTVAKLLHSEVTQSRDGSYMTILGGKAAMYRLRELQGVIPSRRNRINAIIGAGANNPQERAALIRTAQLTDLSDVAVEEYIALLRPPYVAGLLDAGGAFYVQRIKEIDYPRIEVISRNISLLEALQQTFGGNINPKPGDVRSHLWRVTKREEIDSLIEFAKSPDGFAPVQ